MERTLNSNIWSFCKGCNYKVIAREGERFSDTFLHYRV